LFTSNFATAELNASLQPSSGYGKTEISANKQTHWDLDATRPGSFIKQMRAV